MGNITIPTSLIIRPSNAENEVSFYWHPRHSPIYEVISTKDGLRFVYLENGGHQVIQSFNVGDNAFTLDKTVGSLQNARALRLPSEVPDTPVKIGDLAKRMRSHIHKYFDCEPQFESLAVAYAIMTWVYDNLQAVPYLRMFGYYGSGKSRGTDTIGSICYRPLVISGATTASIFRTVDLIGGTVLLDEADYVKTGVGADIAKLLNYGNERGRPIIRNDSKPNGGYRQNAFVPFGPKIISGRERFQDDATESRCFSYTPIATTRSDIPRQLPPEFEEEAAGIRNDALRYRLDNLESFAIHEEHVEGVTPRMNQLLIPVLTIADRIDKETGSCYRKDVLEFAKRQDQAAKDEDNETLEYQLLEEFLKADRSKPVLVQSLVNAINSQSDAADLGSEKLTSKVACKRLREMGFNTSRKNNGRIATIPEGQLSNLKKRFGIEKPREGKEVA